MPYVRRLPSANAIVIIFDIYKQFNINSIEMHIYLTQPLTAHKLCKLFKIIWTTQIVNRSVALLPTPNTRSITTFTSIV